MPEQITKYPDVTIQVLKGAGARCGEGLEQKILKRCPPERFCSMPTGEICVYGIGDIPTMTQVSTAEVARVVCPPEQRAAGGGAVDPPDALVGGVALAAGLAIGALVMKLRSR